LAKSIQTNLQDGMGSPAPFTELLSIFLKQDYGFPVVEIFAFLFSFGILLEYTFAQGSSPVYVAYSYFGAAGTFTIPILVLMILIWKNISFGFGGDFEKGIVATFLVYPLSRGKLLLARLISAVGIPLGLITFTQLIMLYLMTPRFATEQASTLILTYIAVLATPLLITMVVFLVCLWAKGSGTPLIIGIVLYFVIGLFLQLVSGYAAQTVNLSLLYFVFFMNPAVAFQSYYNYRFTGNSNFGFINGNSAWGIPSYDSMITLLVANLAVTAFLLAFCFRWFTKRVEA
jgi:ABC-type transport system involved in multi-copper enzyme maturation permease subunit